MPEVRPQMVATRGDNSDGLPKVQITLVQREENPQEAQVTSTMLTPLLACRSCHVEKPHTREFFRHGRNPLGGKWGLVKTCRECEVKRMSVGRIRKAEQRRSDAERYGLLCFLCGQRKAPTKENFSFRENGYPSSPCRDCRRRQNADYRRTIKGRKRAERYQKSEANLRARKRYEAKLRSVRSTAWLRRHPEVAGAYVNLNYAIRTGRLKKPRLCAGCRAPKGKALCALFIHGYRRPLECVFVCRRCHITAKAFIDAGGSFADWKRERLDERDGLREEAADAQEQRHGNLYTALDILRLNEHEGPVTRDAFAAMTAESGKAPNRAAVERRWLNLRADLKRRGVPHRVAMVDVPDGSSGKIAALTITATAEEVERIWRKG